jgi:hypothetical protein
VPRARTPRATSDAPAGKWTTAEDVRARVLRSWERGELLAARVTQESVFPRRLALRGPSAAELSAHFDAARAWIRELAAAAKAPGRGGFRLEYRAVDHRQLGRNEIPVAAWVDGWPDALALIGKRREAERFDRLVETTRESCPELLPWLAKRPLVALDHTEDWPRLLAAVRWFKANPRPGVYLRQIDAPGVHSKFIERNKSLLAELLDLVLPESGIDRAHGGAAGFERRYGLLEKPVTLRVRFLDPACAIVPAWGGPALTDVGLTAAALAALRPPVQRVFITENETNFLAFPPAPQSLVLFGAGYGFDALAKADWLRERALHYWGDIDTHGFAILDQLRGHLPHAQSFLMDRATLLAHREHWSTEPAPTNRDLPRLTAEEAALYDDLRTDRLGRSVRLEQERIGFALVGKAVASLGT